MTSVWCVDNIHLGKIALSSALRFQVNEAANVFQFVDAANHGIPFLAFVVECAQEIRQRQFWP